MCHYDNDNDYVMKQKIPASLRHNVWIRWVGKNFDAKCTVKWCKNTITPFTFEAGHNIPESKGGATTLENLRPICSTCNKSMGNRYTIEEYSALHGKNKSGCFMFACCIRDGD